MIAAVFVAMMLTAAPPADDPIVRVEQWLKAVSHHQPGTLDAPAEAIASWSDSDLGTLWLDLKNLIALMRDPGGQLMTVNARGQIARRYSDSQAGRLRALACAAAGIVLSDPVCVNRKVASQLDDELRQLAERARDGVGVGADNFVLKRGTLLHTDLVVLAAESTAPLGTPGAGPHRIGVEMVDGQAKGIRQLKGHWDIAHLLVDAVRPTRRDKPAPGRDPMVRDWYRATAAWMQYAEHYDLGHLNHAQELFPDDADLLFLCATQHETYAATRVQALVGTVVLPPGYSLEPQSAREEQRKAETLLRRAIAANPGLAEAHLRLGHLLAIEGQYNDAERELVVSLERLEDPENRYYVHLFLGAIQEATHQYDAAQATFVRAADLFPTAQSPWLALAALARTRGDRADALQAMQHVYARPPDDVADRDPWWMYRLWQARDADRLLDDLRRPFLEVDR
jgi:hypothetical protein